MSRLCGEIDDKVKAFLVCPIEGEYLWIDAVKVRQNGRIVSVAPASLVVARAVENLGSPPSIAAFATI